MARRGNLLLVLRTILQEIATPACGLVRNDTVVRPHVRRFQQLAKLQFNKSTENGTDHWSVPFGIY